MNKTLIKAGEDALIEIAGVFEDLAQKMQSDPALHKFFDQQANEALDNLSNYQELFIYKGGIDAHGRA